MLFRLGPVIYLQNEANINLSVLMDWTVVSLDSYVKALIPKLQIATILGARASKEVSTLKWGWRVGPESGRTGGPYRRRKTQQGGRCRKRKGHVRMQWEGGHLQAKERGPRRNYTCPHSDLGLPDSKPWDIHFCCCKLPIRCYFVMAAWAN